MKKLVSLLIATVIGTCTITYFTCFHHSNDTKAYAYEYYYNETNTQGEISLSSMEHDNSILFANKEFGLSADYVPPNLVVPDIPFSFDEDLEKRYLQKSAADALEVLVADAAKDGIYLYGVSGYRSYARQEDIYNKNLRTKGIEHTAQYSAEPGHSEHQTGLAIDVSCKEINCELEQRFATTKEGIWLTQHAVEYGFIIRYPQDKEAITGYSYEPWHIRYVGKELAKYLSENKLTLEEYFNKPVEEDTTPSLDLVEEF